MWSEPPDRLGSSALGGRTITLFGRLEEESVSEVAARLWSLDALGDDPITVLVSLSGGSVGAASALVDVLDVIGVELRMICLGLVAGPPIALLAAATVREATPSTRFSFRDDVVRFEGPVRRLGELVEEHHEQRYRLLARLAESTGGRRSPGDLVADFGRGLTLSADEAVRYGLVDRVGPERRGRASSRGDSGFGFRGPR